MDGNPPPGPQASCRLARRANPTPLVDNHRKHHHRHPQKPCQETWMLGRTRLAATVARMESRIPGGREPSPHTHLPRRLLHAPNAPANNAITLAIIIHNKRKLRKPFNSFVDATMPTSASRSCTQSQDQADRASLPGRNRKLSSPATKASRSPRIRRPIAPRAATARQQISKSQPRTRRPAPRSGLRSHHINKHEIILAWTLRSRTDHRSLRHRGRTRGRLHPRQTPTPAGNRETLAGLQYPPLFHRISPSDAETRYAEINELSGVRLKDPHLAIQRIEAFRPAQGDDRRLSSHFSLETRVCHEIASATGFPAGDGTMSPPRRDRPGSARRVSDPGCFQVWPRGRGSILGYPAHDFTHCRNSGFGRLGPAAIPGRSGKQDDLSEESPLLHEPFRLAEPFERERVAYDRCKPAFGNMGDGARHVFL